VRLGGDPQKRQLSPDTVPPLARPARREKAIWAVAAWILSAAYHMLKNGTVYHDFGPDHFDHRAKTVQTLRLVTRLQKLGYTVQITPLTA
jgi:transposase